MSMLKETVKQYPEKEALVMNGIRLTYQEMLDKVEKIAGNLQNSLLVWEGRPCGPFIGE